MPVLQLDSAEVHRARALLFEDPRSLALLEQMQQLAPAEVTVLVTGETGTGKEIVAKFLHEHGPRARGPFVAVNCGALSPTLIESELFGHERGAFTGATADREGWFEAANGGTLFLDEVGDMPLSAQVKLLRVLQEREVVRLGARRPIRIDVRLVAATNVRLDHAVAEGRFREDLYYRLHVAHLAVAPLRERPGDIVPLARHFAREYATRLGIRGSTLDEDAIVPLLAHRWPGNIRELENAIHRALLGANGGPVTAAALRLVLAPPPKDVVASGTDEPLERARRELDAALRAWLEHEPAAAHRELEAALYRAAFTISESNQLRTGRLLGLSRNIVRARLQDHGLLAPVRRRDVPVVAALPSPRNDERAVLRVGYQAFGPLTLVKATGALEDALPERRVEWIALDSGMQVIDALVAGAIDLGVAGEVAPVLAQAARAPIVYLAAEPPAPEGEAIIVHAGSAIGSVAALRGRSISVARGANVLYFTMLALEEAGLTLQDVELRALNPSDAAKAFAAGELDAWAVWNPLLASVRAQHATRTLRDAGGLASNRAFYLARRGFAAAQPELVEAFLGTVGAVGRWANGARVEAVRALAAQGDTGLAPAAIEASLARSHFDTRPLDDEVIAAQQRIADAFWQHQLIDRQVPVHEAVWRPHRHVLRSA